MWIILLRGIILISVPRNYDPTLHPFEVPREYIRALNATKLERVFAKPFLASLDGHRDGVNCLAKNPKSLATVLSGACDGDRLKFGSSLNENVFIQYKHIKVFLYEEYVLTFVGLRFFTVHDDKTAKQWKMDGRSYGEEEEPLPTILGKTAYTGIDHHWKNLFFHMWTANRLLGWTKNQSYMFNDLRIWQYKQC